MSQENIELVRAIIDAAPDWQRVRPLLHPDARLDQTRIPDGGVYEGREAFGHFFHRWGAGVHPRGPRKQPSPRWGQSDGQYDASARTSAIRRSAPPAG
jgi:hypothetical protein